tara:strand:+ start:1258 stop:1755 length:498 start_codon:yes stop_codon:yes gene_type:complete
MGAIGDFRREHGPGAIRRGEKAAERFERNQDRKDWSPWKQDDRGRFVNAPKPMTAAQRAQALAAQKRAAAIAKNNFNRNFRSRGGGRIQDPFRRHQNYMANNFMDNARKRFQHMKNDPGGYSKTRHYGNDFYAPIDKSKVWGMRAEDDWNRRRQGQSPRNWRNIF